MSKEVTVEELIANPRDFVEDVKRGEPVRLRLADGRAATIAIDEPALVFEHDPPAGTRLGDYRPAAFARTLDFDPLEILNADREKDRNR